MGYVDHHVTYKTYKDDELFPLVRQPPPLSLSLSLSAFKGGRVPEAYDHNDYMNNTTIKKRDIRTFSTGSAAFPS